MTQPNVLDGLPEELKELDQYETIERRVAEIMKADHKHTKVGAFMKCKKCQPKMAERRTYLQDLGFKDYHQYLKWKQVMGIMKQIDNETKEKAQ